MMISPYCCVAIKTFFLRQNVSHIRSSNLSDVKERARHFYDVERPNSSSSVKKILSKQDAT